MLTALEKKAMREALRLLRELSIDLHTIPAQAGEKAKEHMKAAWPSLTEKGRDATIAAMGAGAGRAIVEVNGKLGQIEDWLKATLNEQTA